MHCPRCGHQQNSDEIRFCTKCGLQISDVKELLAPELAQTKAKRKSEINKAMRQGLAMMLFGFVLITMLAVLRDFFTVPQAFITISALVFCIGGTIRMCLPYLFSENDLTKGKEDAPVDLETNELTGERFFDKSLPEAEYRPPVNFSAKNFDTNELIPIPSVTEVTTRNLEKNFNTNHNSVN